MMPTQDTMQFRRVREDLQTPEQILKHVYVRKVQFFLKKNCILK